MTASLIPTPVMQFLDADGNPLVGGKVYTYAAGTSTPLATFTDYGGATPNANPVILNSRGEASIWFGTAAYKLELYTAATVLIWTADNVSASTPVVYGTGVAAALAINVGTAGSILVNGGVLGTPSSGLVTNLTGTASININGTVGATTATTGAFTTISASGTSTMAAINASGLVAMAGAATIGTTLAVTGTTTAAAINASGTVAMAGAATVGTTLAVTGTSTMAAINASGSVTLSGTSFFRSPTTSNVPGTFNFYLAASGIREGTAGDFNIDTYNGGWGSRLAISQAGAVTIPETLSVSTGAAVGGATPGAGGLAFPATAVAVADANTLDDYEEGTWTPIDSSGASLSLSVASGRYTKIGNLVTCTFRIGYPSTGNVSNMTIGGLPFTANADANPGGGVLNYNSVGTAIAVLGLFVNTSATTWAIRTTTNGAVTNTTLSTADIRGIITYLV